MTQAPTEEEETSGQRRLSSYSNNFNETAANESDKNIIQITGYGSLLIC